MGRYRKIKRSDKSSLNHVIMDIRVEHANVTDYEIENFKKSPAGQHFKLRFCSNRRRGAIQLAATIVAYIQGLD